MLNGEIPSIKMSIEEILQFKQKQLETLPLHQKQGLFVYLYIILYLFIDIRVGKASCKYRY